jgi:hypothetical protein
MDKMIEMYNKFYTLNEIANEFGISRNTTKKRLIKNNIKLRTHGETTAMRSQFKLTPYINDVIIGELLGDGSIYKSGNISGGFTYSTSKKKYLEWLYLGIFKNHGIDIMEEGIKDVIIKPREGFSQINESICYKARTLAYWQFGLFRKKWFPDGIKIVPDDIKITPTVLLHWYLGDGSLHRKKGNNKRGQYDYVYKYVTLHTNGFTYEECSILTSKLNELGLDFGIKKHIYKGKINWQLGLNKPALNNRRFFEYLGDCPELLKNVYGYKWEWRTERHLRNK